MASRKRVIAGAVAVVLAVAIAHYALRGCGETEEDRVAKVVTAIEKAIEDHSLGGVLEHVSERYRDREGVTKAEARGILLYYFHAHKTIEVTITSKIAVTLRKDESAVAVFYARLAESKPEVLTGGGEAFRFELDFKKEDGAWRVVSHRREPAPR